MEWKIGEIKQVNGEWCQCVKSDGTCNGCVGKFQSYSLCNEFDECVGKIFKKLEKVGEPYEFDGYLFQSYRTFEVPIFTENYATVRELGNNSKISIEIKQTKEDMEEKNMETSNLKPFNLEAAKSGKPVCTRDGRKARIICFDRNDCKRIVALVQTNSETESLLECYDDGRVFHSDTNNDLMMLPEKKEGWAVIRIRDIYETEEQAKEVLLNSRTAMMIKKISWEE